MNNRRNILVLENEAKLREYDGLVGLTFNNLCAASNDQKIVLLNFDRKSFEHLYLLRIALLVRDVTNYEIKVDCSWWDLFMLNRKIRKGFKKIKRSKERSGIDTNWMLDLMRGDGQQRIDKNFTFADIYSQYYEGSLN